MLSYNRNENSQKGKSEFGVSRYSENEQMANMLVILIIHVYIAHMYKDMML